MRVSRLPVVLLAFLSACETDDGVITTPIAPAPIAEAATEATPLFSRERPPMSTVWIASFVLKAKNVSLPSPPSNSSSSIPT